MKNMKNYIIIGISVIVFIFLILYLTKKGPVGYYEDLKNFVAQNKADQALSILKKVKNDKGLRKYAFKYGILESAIHAISSKKKNIENRFLPFVQLSLAIMKTCHQESDSSFKPSKQNNNEESDKENLLTPIFQLITFVKKCFRGTDDSYNLSSQDELDKILQKSQYLIIFSIYKSLLNDHQKIAKLLIESREIFNIKDYQILAIIVHNKKCLKNYQKMGYKIVVLDPNQNNLFQMAVKGSPYPYDSIKNILELQLKVDINHQNKKQETVLMQAVKKGMSSVVSLLLSQKNLDVNKKTKNKDTALTLAFYDEEKDDYHRKKRKREAIEALLKSEKLQLNHKNNDGYNALLLAVKKRYHKILEILLKKKANPNSTYINGDTALMYATSKLDIKSMAYLMDAGADFFYVNQEGKSAAKIAKKACSSGSYYDYLTQSDRLKHAKKCLQLAKLLAQNIKTSIQ